MVDVVCGNYIGVLLGEFSWEVLFSILSLILLVNLSHMGLVPIWLKFIKRFRKGVWGITLLQKGFPQLPRRGAAVYLRFTHFTGFIIGAIGTGFSAAEAACIVHGVV